MRGGVSESLPTNPDDTQANGAILFGINHPNYVTTNRGEKAPGAKNDTGHIVDEVKSNLVVKITGVKNAALIA